MKICVIGTGYVGLVVGTCFADMGNFVICVDNDEEKLNKLKNGIIPIYEPGLEDLIKYNVGEKRLMFTSNLEYAIKESLICFIAVGTPQGDDGKADMKYVYNVAEQIGRALNGYKVIVDKSTVPVGTAEKVTEIIRENAPEEFKNEFDVVSNPEFLKQGAAVEDSLKPDRIVIGSNSERATKIMHELYSAFLRTGNPVITMDVKSAEMTKYAANSFLAVKISYINEIANICEKVGANVDMVRLGMAADRRIGSQFLFPGLGYGGSCFPKDVKALLNTAKENDCEYSILKSADHVNFNQREVFIKKIEKYYNNNIKGKTFGVWGLAFKPNTNDMREAPAITIINALLEKGAIIKAYDPKAMENAKLIFGDKITYSSSSYNALEDVDALLLITEWNEFRRPDFARIANILKDKIIFDGRNIYDRNILESRGLKYIRIG
ncbi:UDP-glucose/GDP-mannose dehydrogenase family protein [Brachyspira pulli]|uniref:UDP-glucose dehydrogenase family protein n=1 Tax=Brachyspira pulli TaxID=310721 RepID=UPI0030072B7C